MTSFRTRIRRASRDRGPVILANDYPASARSLEKRALANVRGLGDHLCGIKLNLHLLLPLGGGEIRRITGAARDRGLVAIADIKLNDIGSTNLAAAERLWGMGFDAVIANPVMGPGGLREVVRRAHRGGRGVIALCHMSAPEARPAYDMQVRRPASRLYRVFLRWALGAGADGVVAGATYPDVIRHCRRAARGGLDVYSPGVGAQGGDPGGAASAGADYLIVGRGIIGARDPAAEARRIQESVLSR